MLSDQISNRVKNSIENSYAVKPLFYRLKNEKDKKEFENLLSNDASLAIYDNFYEQLKELNKIKSLQRRSTETQQRDLQYETLEEEGVWVYYPWLKKIIHILDEEDFILVRTNRNQHKITYKEQSILQEKKVGIIGMSVGQSIAMALVLERGCGEIRIADFDTLELSNLNRIQTGLYNLGQKKTIQAARQIAEIDPYFIITCYEEGITQDNVDDFLNNGGKLDLLIEECDSLDIKILSRLKAKQYRIPVLMETNDRGMIDIERYDLNADYPLLHNLIGDVSWEKLSNLTNEQKIPILMKMTNFKNISLRQKLTVLEIGHSISTWPQLGSSVVTGAGVTADVARRILLSQLTVSGRFYVDPESIISDNKPVLSSYSPPVIKELSAEEMHQTATRILTAVIPNNITTPKETIEAIVLDASTAPSSGNDQPWKFFLLENKLFLFHEAARSYSFGDYKNIASYTSLGGVIENTVLSAHKHGLQISVTLFPDKSNNKCVAFFEFKTDTDNTTESHKWDHLYDYIHQRYTNRSIIPNEKATEEILDRLRLVAESVNCIKASFVTNKEELQVLGYIISAGDRIRIMHPQGHYDFFNREIRASPEEAEAKRTGMDINSLELTQQAVLALELISQEKIITVLREINGLQSLKTVSVPTVVNAAAMGFIEVPSFTPSHFINGGRAMQRQWLEATSLGYAYHPMMIPVYLFYRLEFGNGEGLTKEIIHELKTLRKKFLAIFPGEEKRGEVLLFRIFKADNVIKRTPRLPLEEILYTN